MNSTSWAQSTWTGSACATASPIGWLSLIKYLYLFFNCQEQVYAYLHSPVDLSQPHKQFSIWIMSSVRVCRCWRSLPKTTEIYYVPQYFHGETSLIFPRQSCASIFILPCVRIATVDSGACKRWLVSIVWNQFVIHKISVFWLLVLQKLKTVRNKPRVKLTLTLQDDPYLRPFNACPVPPQIRCMMNLRFTSYCYISDED